VITLSNENFYTLEEVQSISGYKKGTIYNLTNAAIISAPVRGLDTSVYSSQGLYPELVFKELKLYQDLKIAGKTKREISLLLRAERANNELLLPILETRA